MALVGNLDCFECGAPRAHGFNRGFRQKVGVCTADHHHRHTRERVEFLPECGDRALGIDPVQRVREPDVVGRHQPAFLFLECAVGAGKPLGLSEFWKLRAEEPAQDLRAFLESSRLRQLANIAFDAHQPLRLEHRANIVENGSGNRGRPDGGEQHGQDSTARGADKNRRQGFECSDDGEDIGEFDRKRIVGGVTVVTGSSASARVERDDAARGRLSCVSADASASKSAAVRARPGRHTTGVAAELRRP